jgi:hypothetical protein
MKPKKSIINIQQPKYGGAPGSTHCVLGVWPPYSVVLQGRFRLVFTLLNIRCPIYCGRALGAGHLSTSKNVTPSVSRRCRTAIIFTPISFN